MAATGIAGVLVAGALAAAALDAPARPGSRQSKPPAHRAPLLGGLEAVELVPPLTAWNTSTTTTTPAPPPTTTTTVPATVELAPAVTAQRTGVDWDSLGTCETGGDPRNPNPGHVWWGMTGPTYSGGVGFYNGTWDSFGGREFADLAGHATRERQIIVAERVYARYGLSGWGCRAYG